MGALGCEWGKAIEKQKNACHFSATEARDELNLSWALSFFHLFLGLFSERKETKTTVEGLRGNWFRERVFVTFWPTKSKRISSLWLEEKSTSYKLALAMRLLFGICIMEWSVWKTLLSRVISMSYIGAKYYDYERSMFYSYIIPFVQYDLFLRTAN